MQNMLENLLGGQPKRRREYDDFVNRYEQGPPWAGISDQEAIERYEEVAPHLPPEVYEESAYEAFNRMSPRERRQFAQYVRQQTRQQGAHFPDLDQDGIDDRIEQDPRVMAQIAGRMHRQQPGMFGQIARGGRERPRRPGQQRRRRRKQEGGPEKSDLLGNPMAKAALAGITAVAVKKMMR